MESCFYLIAVVVTFGVLFTLFADSIFYAMDLMFSKKKIPTRLKGRTREHRTKVMMPPGKATPKTKGN